LGPENSLAPDPLSPQLEAESSSDSTNSETTTSPPDIEEDTSSDTGSGGAFNPVTGEINWDCPCLGGMAHGPCGPQFRDAFSCFVFSEEEPKGINCVEKFKAMQTCFRDHPEIYGDGTSGCDLVMLMR
jgi:intermembrane space import and assembly protein 40